MKSFEKIENIRDIRKKLGLNKWTSGAASV